MSLSREVENLIPALAELDTPAMSTDLGGVIRWINPSFSRLMGYEAGQLAGRGVIELFADRQDSATSVGLENIVESGMAWTADSEWRRGDGERLPVSLHATPIKDSAGVSTHVLWLVRSPLGLRPDHYAEVFATMAEGVVFQNGDGSIELCNAAAERILGLTRDQMAGRTSIDPRWNAIHEDGSPFPGETHPAMVTLRTGEAQTNVVMGVQRPDGTFVWISINSRPLQVEGDPRHKVVTTFHDITKQRQMQEILRRAETQIAKGFMASPAMTTLSAVQSDGTVRLIDVNEAFERGTGYRRDEVIGHTTHELGLWVDRQAQEAAVEDFKKHGVVREVEFQFRKKNGDVAEGLISVNTVELWGRMLAVASLSDITERKRAEAALEKLAYELSLTERHYRQLFDGVFDAVLVVEVDEQGLDVSVLDANQQACVLLGYSREELLRLKGSDLNAPGDVVDMQALLRHIWAEGRVVSTGVLVSKLGTRVSVEISTQRVAVNDRMRLVSTLRPR